MVDDITSSTEPADEGTVILVSPEGVEVEASTPVTINDLVYGKGYRLKGNADPEAAAKAAAPEAGQQPVTAEPAGAATGTQTAASAAPPADAKPSAPSTSKSSGKPATGAPSTT